MESIWVVHYLDDLPVLANKYGTFLLGKKKYFTCETRRIEGNLLATNDFFRVENIGLPLS